MSRQYNNGRVEEHTKQRGFHGYRLAINSARPEAQTLSQSVPGGVLFSLEAGLYHYKLIVI